MSESVSSTVVARFISDTGEMVSNMMDLPRNITVDNLQLICNSILKKVIKLTISTVSKTVELGSVWHLLYFNRYDKLKNNKF